MSTNKLITKLAEITISDYVKVDKVNCCGMELYSLSNPVGDVYGNVTFDEYDIPKIIDALNKLMNVHEQDPKIKKIISMKEWRQDKTKRGTRLSKV